MSSGYQNGQTPNNGYWAGNVSTDAYGRQLQIPPPPPPSIQQYPTSQYQHLPETLPQPQSTSTRTQQAYDPNAQVDYGLGLLNGYAMTPGAYTVNQNYSQSSPQIRTPSVPQFASSPQIRTSSVPQFISPSQLYQQSPSAIQPNTSQAYQYQHSTQPQPRTHSSSAHAIPRMAPVLQDPHIERAKLLVSLAEEYFQAAHAIAPAVSLSMSSADVESYEKLIATGLGCLDTALKRVKLSPRMEANIRLRYAGVLFEETENSMEAETCLSKGISLCERNHYYDLKYAMQFMLTQFMARNNPKAAMKALDSHISETQTYQHHAWVYVFRLLRASLGIECGTPTDIHVAVQHLQAVAALATMQRDYYVHVVASLMETMAHLRTAGPGTSEHVRASIAAAWMNQNSSGDLPQLKSLTHILDVICSYEDGNSDLILEKLKLMQKMMDNALKDPTWSYTNDAITIPIRGTPKSSQIVSRDTRMILGIGDDGGDQLMLSFMGKRDIFAASYLLCGVCFFHKNNADTKALRYLHIGLDSLEGKDTNSRPPKFGLLPDLMVKAKWRGNLVCYFRVMMAFCHANAGCWPEMRQCLSDLEGATIKYEIDLAGPLGLYMKYLQGVYCQGTLNLTAALNIFEDEAFRIAALKSSHISASAQFERDIGTLAMLNRLSIFQAPEFVDPKRNSAMLEELKPLCVNCPIKDIESAFNILAGAIQTSPPTLYHEQKNHLRLALGSAQKTKNTHFMAMMFAIMFNNFFVRVVGDQAEKSARSASFQAQKHGMPLWRSVAEGMLADCLVVQGKDDEARHVRMGAQAWARKAMPRETKMEK